MSKKILGILKDLSWQSLPHYTEEVAFCYFCVLVV